MGFINPPTSLFAKLCSAVAGFVAVCGLPSAWLVSIKWMVLLAAEACVACLPWV